MGQTELTLKEWIAYLAIIGAVVGLVFGLIALFLAVKRKKTKLGVIALVCCVALTAFMPLLGFIAFIVFLWLILKKPAVGSADEIPAGTESPADTDVN